MAVIGNVKKSWQEFKADEPGHRFKERYRRRQESEYGWLDPSRLFNVIVGTILIVGSAFFGWAPGPGMLTFFIGLGMVAGEFGPAARLLDWSEVRARQVWRFTTDVWRASAMGKALLVAAALVLGAAALYAAYRLLFG